MSNGKEARPGIAAPQVQQTQELPLRNNKNTLTVGQKARRLAGLLVVVGGTMLGCDQPAQGVVNQQTKPSSGISSPVVTETLTPTPTVIVTATQELQSYPSPEQKIQTPKVELAEGQVWKGTYTGNEQTSAGELQITGIDNEEFTGKSDWAEWGKAKFEGSVVSTTAILEKNDIDAERWKLMYELISPSDPFITVQFEDKEIIEEKGPGLDTTGKYYAFMTDKEIVGRWFSPGKYTPEGEFTMELSS